ncbi:MAG: hypothetical protein J5939_04280 [Bacteroidales bacterium]|nr:hypothetical protein [Bacteroidales bacterium]
MIRRNKKTRKYQTPRAVVTHVVFESNFCQTVRFNVQVDELRNINKEVEAGTSNEPLYFEF